MNPSIPLPELHVLQRRSDNRRFAELDADTMPMLHKLKLDTKRSAYVGRKGNIVLWLTDIETAPRKSEPALLLVNRAATERNVYVRLGELWLLIDPSDVHEADNQRIAIHALTERLFGFVTKDDCFRVLDAIYEFAQDLVHAKPPVWITNAQWLQALAEDDMTVTAGGIVLNG